MRTFRTAPHGCPHLIVRVETNEPGLYGLGRAGDPQRTLAVRTVRDEYVGPLPHGREPDDIEELHRLLLNSGYWQGGSVESNALGGVDVALWGLKAKRLGAPLYSLFGGRVRRAAEAYTHVERRVPWDSAAYLRTVPKALARIRELATAPRPRTTAAVRFLNGWRRSYAIWNVREFTARSRSLCKLIPLTSCLRNSPTAFPGMQAGP
ncbi:hypothetical protein ACFU76_18905 [Streptomyces sp. NPDC057539]|uniref:hypothetical protein n=1 Tax=Streptomyces sp. NPDC057539 TaxID=3346159 RepID=UPI0036C70775